MRFHKMVEILSLALHHWIMLWVSCHTTLRDGGVCRESPGCGPGQPWDVGEESFQARCGGRGVAVMWLL